MIGAGEETVGMAPSVTLPLRDEIVHLAVEGLALSGAEAEGTSVPGWNPIGMMTAMASTTRETFGMQLDS
jgi:hypothetical protein